MPSSILPSSNIIMDTLCTHLSERRLLPLTLTLLFPPLLYLSVTDYLAWYNLGTSGVPHNPFGWLLQTLLRPFAKEQFSTTIYTNPKTLSQGGTATFINETDIPTREGIRPAVGPWVVPHRQLREIASINLKKEIQLHILSFPSHFPSELKIQRSNMERHNSALFLSTPSSSQHTVALQLRGEIAHMHEADGSMHVVLSPLDAKLVIEKGWGQRHGLSGTKLMWIGYLLVYAPRNEEELVIVKRILGAAVEFMLRRSGK